MNKSVCKKCRSRCSIPWCEDDDKSWDRGFVTCPNWEIYCWREDGMPEGCLYPLEQVVVSESRRSRRKRYKEIQRLKNATK